MYSGVIYRITCKVTGKSYIGKTSDKYFKRYINRHFNNAFNKSDKRGGGRGKTLYHAIRKHGREQFEVEVLEEVRDELLELFWSKLGSLEIYYISKYNTYKHGYNMVPGSGGSKWSEERRNRYIKKITGHVVTKETRGKLRKALLGHKDSEETKIKKGNWSRGKTYEELYGKEKADELRNIRRGFLLGKYKNISLENRYGKDKANKLKRDSSIRTSGNGNPMYGKSVFDVWVEKYGIETANIKRKEAIEKRLKAIKQNRGL